MNCNDILLFCSKYERKYQICSWATVIGVKQWK